jgi:phosphoserine phosphatase
MYPRLMFFDLEGTLLKKAYHLDNGKVAPSAWTLLAEALGPECLAEEEVTKDRWQRREYPGYVEWMRDTIRIHKKYGLKRKTFDEVMNSVEIMPNAGKAFDVLRTNRTITAVITGGFKALADRVQRELKIDHAFAGCEYFFDPASGEIEHFNLLPSDEKGKVQFMRLTAEEHGISEHECAFVGDGKNDVLLAQAVGFSIAFNAQEDLRRVATACIDQEQGEEDFLAVIEKLQNRPLTEKS